MTSVLCVSYYVIENWMVDSLLSSVASSLLLCLEPWFFGTYIPGNMLIVFAALLDLVILQSWLCCNSYCDLKRYKESTC